MEFQLYLPNDYTVSDIKLLQYFLVEQLYSENRVNGTITTMTFGGIECPIIGIAESLSLSSRN